MGQLQETGRKKNFEDNGKFTFVENCKLTHSRMSMNCKHKQHEENYTKTHNCSSDKILILQKEKRT